MKADEFKYISTLLERVIHKYIQMEKQTVDSGNGILLSQPEIQTIMLIGKYPGISVTEIAKRRGITKGTASQMLYKLASLLLMWIGYYADNNLFKDNMLFTLIVSLLLIIMGLCTLFPVIWVTRITNEGIQGLGITTKKLGLSLAFSVVLGAWRFMGITEYLNSPQLPLLSRC